MQMPVASFRRSVLIVALLAMAGIPLPASAADTVKLAAITRTVFYVPLWVAMHRGFLKDEGLDVQVTFFVPAQVGQAFLRSRACRFCWTSVLGFDSRMR
jgi:ABC-type nitrate/sulfonate/bicarbonate transport system substrate-binding protein